MTEPNVKIQWRQDYGDNWKTIIGPHPIGMALMDKMRKLNREDPTKHLAVFIDGVLNTAWTPGAGYGEPLEVIINGERYGPET